MWLKIASVLLLSLGLASCSKEPNFSPKQPDEVLFDRAMYALENNRFDVAGIDLQTLINTYPSSEYAAAAKKVLEDDPHLAECTPPADANMVFRSEGRSCDH